MVIQLIQNKHLREDQVYGLENELRDGKIVGHFFARSAVPGQDIVVESRAASRPRSAISESKKLLMQYSDPSDDPQVPPAVNPYAPPVVGLPKMAVDPTAPGDMRHDFKYPTQTLMQFVCFMLAANGFIGLVAIGSGVMQLNLISQTPVDPLLAEQNDFRQSAISIIAFVCYLVTGICFCTWINRSHHNVRWFGAQELTISPNWAVGYFFVPIMNLFRPYQAMQELWQASKSPGNWELISKSTLVGVWWTLWIVSSIFGRLASRIGNSAETIPALQSATVVEICSNILDIPLCVVAVLILREIQQAQNQWVEQWVERV